jgi:hypothetical protein
MPLILNSCSVVRHISVERVVASDSLQQQLRSRAIRAGAPSRLGRRMAGDSAMLRNVNSGHLQG